MNKSVKKVLLSFRNHWGGDNSIKSDSKFRIDLRGNLLKTKIRIRGNSRLMIAEECRLRDAVISIEGGNNVVSLEEGVFFSGRIEVRGTGNTVRIGRNTRVNGAELVVHNGTRLDIGPGCLFSDRIDLRTTDSHSIYNNSGERTNPDKDIVIGKGVWIGRMVSVLKGANIGAGSVIGSMSVVSGKIPERVVAAGVPARPIKKDITWD